MKDCWNGRGPLTKMAAMPIHNKNLLKSSSQEPNKPWGLIFAQILGDRRSTKISKIILCWRFTFLRQGQICFPIHLYGPYIFIWKNVENSYFGHLLCNQLNQNLMMSILALMKHKIAKWADTKSKMATTAAILKISYLFSNLRLLWAETCSLATGWLLDLNKLKLCRSKIPDGRSGSAPLNKIVLGQWPDFKTCAKKCSTNGPQPKLQKWLRLDEQNGSQS